MLTLNLNQVKLSDISNVGGKAASLGELIQSLEHKRIKVPSGFVVTVEGYLNYLDDNNINIPKTFNGMNEKPEDIRNKILKGVMSENLKKEIKDAYNKLEIKDVAIRSSATAEDLPNASFAGQQDTYLHISGEENIFTKIKECFASLFNDRAVSYRESRGYSHAPPGKKGESGIGIAVVVQEMVRSDKGTAGVAFSLDTESGFEGVVLINGSYGLGEMLVSGAITPDEYVVFKKTGKCISRRLGMKEKEMIYMGDETIINDIDVKRRNKFCLSVEQVEKLAGWVCIIEEHYSELHGKYCPVDVEWAIDGVFDELYIVQARPETIHSQKDKLKLSQYNLASQRDAGCVGQVTNLVVSDNLMNSVNQKEVGLCKNRQAAPVRPLSSLDPLGRRMGCVANPSSWLRQPDELCSSRETLLEGIAVGDKISSGKVRIVKNLEDGIKFEDNDVLVTDMTNPDWEPLMKRASAIITNRGGRTCHAAIVAREMGLPAIVGTMNCTEILTKDQEVTVSCSEGETGYIYNGIIPYEVEDIDIEMLRIKLESLETQIMMNIGSPDSAFKYASLPNKGLGLAREEFIINNYIKIHPLALLNYGEPVYPRMGQDQSREELLEEHNRYIKEVSVNSEIDKMIVGYESPSEYFISKLSDGIAKLGAAFYPNDVILRFSDFKSNEYSNLVGGYKYEPDEENPMLGWRGASRYYSKEYRKAFGLECIAVKRVREEMGLSNVIVMIPFCRSLEELRKVYEVMEEYGLKRGENGLKVYIMAEIPSNIILAEEFAEEVDGFSIGSNDLTQLTLGVDRDSNLVSNVYDERNPAVVKSVQRLIKVGRETSTKVGICGQAPSDFPEFAQMLVEANINSISVTPDALPRTVERIYNLVNK